MLFVVAGFTLLLAGIAMLVLPGPALAVIPVALAILSLEFAWAGRALETAIEQAEKAKQTAKETSRFQRIVVAVATVLGDRRRDRRLDPVGDPDRPVHLGSPDRCISGRQPEAAA